MAITDFAADSVVSRHPSNNSRHILSVVHLTDVCRTPWRAFGASQAMVRPLQKRRKGRVWVVVLGDFGRSPRMQNHALSLAKQVCQ